MRVRFFFVFSGWIYIKLYFFYFENEKYEFNEWDFYGYCKFIKKIKIWLGNNLSWLVYNIYWYMCKFFFRLGDWYVYLY